MTHIHPDTHADARYRHMIKADELVDSEPGRSRAHSQLAIVHALSEMIERSQQ